MDKSEELFTNTLTELSNISTRLQEISKVEDSFQARMEELSHRVDELYARQKEIISDFDLLSAAVKDLENTFSSVEFLQEKIKDLQRNLESLDIQGLGEKLDNAADEISRATAKLTAAEKRSQEAKNKKNLGKK